MKPRALVLVPLLIPVFAAGGEAAAPGLPDQAAGGLRRAVRYFHGTVATHGSYLWSYSADLKSRRGEREATDTQGWVQPPGTPAVGMALLQAHRATGERAYLDAARDAGRALARTQLETGGWDYVIEFHPERAKQWYYRRDREAGQAEGGRRNTSTYDDNNSQSALRLLMRLDRALKGEDAEISAAVTYGLRKLREARYPNGAWPQRFAGRPRSDAEYPVRAARYPETWPRTYPAARYEEYYTFNDNALRDVVLTFLEAHRLYGKPEYLDAARGGGDFILLAQMPEPQPAWCQQYNLAMEPAWARRFEPPAIVSGESGGVIRTLLDLYLYTGDAKYLRPIPPAIAWLRRSRLPGPEESPRWARFYELKTNRPLYFTRAYELVYTDGDLPTHYSFQSQYGLPAVMALHERIVKEGRDAYRAAEERRRTAAELRRAAERQAPQVRAILAAMDGEGRWLEEGSIRSATFIRNVEALAEYLAAERGTDLR